MTEKERNQNIKYMEYAIHSNELEGQKYTDKEKDFLMSVAEEKISIEEAIKTILNK